MADLLLLQDLTDCGDGDDYGENDMIGSILDITTQDELLSPLDRLRKYVDSDNLFHRQMIARSIVDTLKAVSDEDKECSAVFRAMLRLSEDIEPSVRSELMEQVPHVAMFCHEMSSRPYFQEPISQYIVQMIVNYLTDTNNQVRKTSQAALLVLLEQGVFKKSDVEEMICPVIVNLTNADSSDDLRTEAVALMSKVATLIGKMLSEKLFLHRFGELCLDSLFHVRKVCAANFGDMCNVVGTDPTERLLLPRFYYLCEDGVWGVRKACAECFMAVSYACSASTRHKDLTPLFISLICDQSRWVRMAAFQALGPFISTFADSSKSGVYFNDDGCLMAISDELLLQNAIKAAEKKKRENADSYTNEHNSDTYPTSHPDTTAETEEIKLGNKSEESAFNEFNFWSCPLPVVDTTLFIDTNNTTSQTLQLPEIETETNSNHTTSSETETELTDTPPSAPSENLTNIHEQSTESQSEEDNVAIATGSDNDPDTAVSEEEEEEGVGGESDQLTGEGSDELTGKGSGELIDSNDPLHKALVEEYIMFGEHAANIGSTHVIGTQVNELTVFQNTNANIEDIHSEYYEETSAVGSADPGSVDYDPFSHQDTVPQSLLEHYISMIDPARAQTVDLEIAKHCAYSIPAVAFTLGRRNWICIKNVYETLAQDMQWKVRRTLAFSLHDLAIILGQEITCCDLVPVFNSFLKDLDEVRIGILKHLSEFLKLVSTDLQITYLAKLNVFLSTDNSRNWRFRMDLAEQLIDLCELYEPQEINEYICPIALTLASDRVAEVRKTASRLVAVVLKHLRDSEELVNCNNLIRTIINRYAYCPQWFGRRMFADLCQSAVDERSLPHEQFAVDLLPNLLALKNDCVPNVRMAVARTLVQSISPLEYFSSYKNPQHEPLISAVKLLQSDGDRDVRFYSTLSNPYKHHEDAVRSFVFIDVSGGCLRELFCEKMKRSLISEYQ